MEKNIRLLEWFIELCKHNELGFDKEVQAIESLIKGYKELEKENKASKEAINTLTNKLEKVVEENEISEEEKSVLEAYRNYKEISGSNSWIICNPNTMWSEYFIPISVIQNKIDELKEIADDDNIAEYIKIDILKEILEKGNK